MATATAEQREVGREQRELMCKLTEAELLQRGETMADADLEIGKLKETRKGINGQIADLTTTRSKLAKIIDDGEELRMVDCAWIEDLPQNVQNCVRQDTGELVTSRAMTAADRQEGFAFADGDADDAPIDEDTGEVLLKLESVDVSAQDIGELPKPTKRKAKPKATALKAAKGKQHKGGSGKASNGKRGATRHAHA
jgi:hypothetical protein